MTRSSDREREGASGTSRAPHDVFAGRGSGRPPGAEERLALPGGECLTVRPIAPDDVDRLRRLFYRLSPRSIYYRFFSVVVQPSEAALRYLATVDYHDRHALVALHGDEIVAVARYHRLDNGAEAELGVLVEDAWQSRGLGKLLLSRLAAVARAHAVSAFRGSILGENRRAVALLQTVFPGLRVEFASGEYLAHAPLTDYRPLWQAARRCC